MGRVSPAGSSAVESCSDILDARDVRLHLAALLGQEGGEGRDLLLQLVQLFARLPHIHLLLGPHAQL